MSDAAATGDREDGDGAAYGGLFGAFPYAFRASGSRLFRSYVVVGGLVAALVALLFLLALPQWIAATTRAPASATLSRAFLALVGLAVFAPLVAPVLLVARGHRRGRSDARYDAAVGACGYLFVVAGYLGLALAAPDTLVPDAYRAAGAAPPLLAIAALWLVHRRLR